MEDTILNKEVTQSMIQYTETSTKRTLTNIKKTLEENLKNKYGIIDHEMTDNFLKIHGLSEYNFDFIKNVETIINEQLNDVSIDDNSNKGDKTIEGIFAEVSASLKKAVGFRYIFETMKQLYGKQEANFLMGEMLDLSLGLSDSTNILKPYCWSMDATKLILVGRDFGVLQSGPSKRFTSYISALCETVHQMSSHLAGAIAIGSLFLDASNLLLFKELYSLKEIQSDFKIRKYIENEFQQLVHSVNHLSRNSNESPFTNVSIFDRPKLEVLLSKENYEWYFEIKDEIKTKVSSELKEFDNDWKKYIIEYIMEVQNIFLEFFNKGDPIKNGSPYRFPICTINFSKHKYGDRYLISDQKFLKDVCKLDIFRYNIFASEGSKVASCCRLISNSEMMELASQSNSFGAGGSISLGSHRVLTINFNRIALEANTEEEFYSILNNRIESGIKILKAHKELLLRLKDRGLQQFISNGWINMNRLFSTIGVLGVYEATVLYKKKFKSKNKDITEEILKYLNEKINEYSTKYDIISNIEQIPGESFAVRLCKADKYIYGCEQVPYQLYANQFVPLWEKVSIWERMKEDGKYNLLYSGGGIVHITIGEKVTSKQAEKIIKFAIDGGCEHFALNAIYSECTNKHTHLGKYELCPTCEEKIVEYYTRVVGFFTPVGSWNETRRVWEFPKRYIQDMREIKEND